MPANIAKWLTEEGRILYQLFVKFKEADPGSGCWGKAIFTLECLAEERERSERRRQLLEKRQWIEHQNRLRYCPECGREECYGHGPDCLWAQAIHTDGPSGTIGKGE